MVFTKNIEQRSSSQAYSHRGSRAVTDLVLDTKTADILVQRYNAMLLYQSIVVLTRLLLLIAACVKVLTICPWSSLPRVWVEGAFFFMIFNALHFFGIIIEGSSQLFGASVFGRSRWILPADKVELGRWYDVWSMLGVVYDCLLRCGVSLFLLTGNGWCAASIASAVGFLELIAILGSHGVCRSYNTNTNAIWTKRFLRSLEFGFMAVSWLGLMSSVAVSWEVVSMTALVLAVGSAAVVGRVVGLSSKLLASLDGLDYGCRNYFWQGRTGDPVRSWSVQRDIDATRLVNYCTRGSLECVSENFEQKNSKAL